MSVRFHRERSAVLVSEPAADCWDVHARFNTGRGEEVSEIVMSELRKAQSPASRLKTFLGVSDLHNRVFRHRLGFLLELFQETSECTGHRNEAE